MKKTTPADPFLKSERLQTDQITSKSRHVEDLAANQKREKSGLHFEDEKKIGNDQLIKERERSDRAIEYERSQVDLI